jgi:uncharacterized protein (UPF0147 family)
MSKQFKVSQQTINSVVSDVVDETIFSDKSFRANVRKAAMEALEKKLASPEFSKLINKTADKEIGYVLEDGLQNVMNDAQYKEFAQKIVASVLKQLK